MSLQRLGASIAAAGHTVAGIDIGGARKGCHLVVLCGLEIIHVEVDAKPSVLAARCNAFGAVIIGVDAPCGWSAASSSRLAERELAQRSISSFATPTRERAEANQSGFYDWMFAGADMYRALDATHGLQKQREYTGGKVCFETFPHAVTCHLLGRENVSARKKFQQRKDLLDALGVDTSRLRSIDARDAALCAITAACLALGYVTSFGDADGGLIFVPVLPDA